MVVAHNHGCASAGSFKGQFCGARASIYQKDNPQVTGPVPFKPMLLQGQLYELFSLETSNAFLVMTHFLICNNLLCLYPPPHHQPCQKCPFLVVFPPKNQFFTLLITFDLHLFIFFLILLMFYFILIISFYFLFMYHFLHS